MTMRFHLATETLAIDTYEEVEILSPSDLRRFLQENGTDDGGDDENTIDGNDLQVLINTLVVYGGIFLVLFLLFCWVRRKYPRAYNIRNWVDDWKTPLAAQQYGFFSWFSKLFLISDSAMLDECGMDAICFIRVIQFGFKIAFFGMINALWLVPVYATAAEHVDTENVTDPVAMITTGHLPPGSRRFIGTVAASYLLFGFTMYLMIKEFRWFIASRHRFLSKPLPRNYAVYVQCIPKEYRSNGKLLKFFRESVSRDCVLDAHILIKTSQLKDKADERKKVIKKLEHAINKKNVKGVIPTKRSRGIIGHKINLIEDLYEELNNLNGDISKRISKIEEADDSYLSTEENTPQPTVLKSRSTSQRLLSGSFDQGKGTRNRLSIDGHQTNAKDVPGSNSSDSNSEEGEDGNLAGVKEFITLPFKGAAGVAETAKGLLSSEDGEPESAAFVTFKTLTAAQTALQMLHYPRPFAMEAREAPSPEDVFWENTSKSNQELQLGNLASLLLTATLCLFWTIPQSFVSSLSTVEGLRGEVEFVDSLLDTSPWLIPVFEIVAPLLIVLLNVLLKVVLRVLSMLEGPISGSVVEASLFSKLAIFMIIQTFFISTLSGSLIPALTGLLEDPIGEGIPLLANELPSRSTFFLQILLVDTFINMGMEILRVVPIGMAIARHYLGPRLSKKERNSTWLGLRPLADPKEFEHADVLSGSVLYFMVLFVYGPIAPLVNFFLAFCFLLMNACYRNQFIYVYPTFPDSGGHLWLRFFKIVPTMMLIAQITIIGLCSIKLAPIAVALMAPLIGITVIFRGYIKQKHFEMAKYLPAHDAMMVDLNSSAETNLDFVRDKYIQPELRDKIVRPENDMSEREFNQMDDV